MSKKIIFFVCMPIIAWMAFWGWSYLNKKSHKVFEVRNGDSEYQTFENDISEAVSEEPEKEDGETEDASTLDKNKDIISPVSNEEIKKEESGTKEKATPEPFQIRDRLVTWGYEKASGRKIDTVIIHSSYNAVGSDVHDLSDIINKEYKPYGVSPHYIIARDGKTYRLVEDKNIAYHAGNSKMPDSRTGVNGFSIGIEIINTKSESPSQAQYVSLKKLVARLKEQYKIKYVLGHKDIAPGRKDDPWNFDFEKIK